MPGSNERNKKQNTRRRGNTRLALGLAAAVGFFFPQTSLLAQYPNDPPAPPRGLQTLLPPSTKDPSVFANPQAPATPTLVIPGSKQPETLGVQAATDQIVTKVRFVGNRRLVEEQLKNMISTREGQPYLPEKVRNDVRMLDSTGRYIGGVRVEEYKTNEGVVLTFQVFERALIDEVVYQGARHMSRDDLETNSGLKKNMPMNVAINKVACQRLEPVSYTHLTLPTNREV